VPKSPSLFLAGRKPYAEREHDRKRRFNVDRPRECSRLYDYRWTRYRAVYLAEHPLCVECLRAGVAEPATVIHHVRDHRGDAALFWDQGNHVAICKRCHDAHTARTVLNFRPGRQ
jgi:5-methylcytosine-specific restriction enzyme A